MRVLFTCCLLSSDQGHTGTFIYRIVELSFLPGIGMDIDGFGLHGRKVVEVTVNLEAKSYDAYVKLNGITCPTKEDFQDIIESLKGNGWRIQYK